ncbi:MAG: BON domain-containing protein [Bryobacteraceae bacterium]
MKIASTISTLVVAATLMALPTFAATNGAPVSNPNLERDVRHAINTLAYYGVFDDLNFSIDPTGAVTLSGQVMQYSVHNNALKAVRNVSGVTQVNDQIEVLPLSPFDNNIRIRAYNAIFGFPALSRYALNSRSPVRILVKNGNVTIAGVVNNELDRTLIYSRLQSLPQVFSVTNHLRLDSDVTD